MSEPLTDDEIAAWPTRVDPMCGCAGEPHTCHSDSDTLRIMQLVRERDRARGEVRRLRKNTDTLYAMVAADSAARDNLRDQLVDKDAEIDRLRAFEDAYHAVNDELRGVVVTTEPTGQPCVDRIRTLRARELTDDERRSMAAHVEWLRTFGRADGFKVLAVLDRLLGGGGK